MSIKVMIVEPGEIIRASLRCLLSEAGDVEVVAETGDGRSAVEQAPEIWPDVALVETNLPELNGVEAARQLSRLTPPVAVVALTLRRDRQTVIEMLEAGACGYVLKTSPVEDLFRAIEAGYRGDKFLSPPIADLLVDSYQQQIHPEDEAQAPGQLLGDRERQVLQLIAEGKTSAEIAAEMHLATSTVNTHRRNVMRKLDIHSIAGLTKYAVREGLSGLEQALE